MPIVVKRPKALADLAKVWDYIADDSEELADAFIAAIDAKFRTLSQHPAMGRRRDELAPGLRSFPVGRYLVFYLPLSDGVEIVRVLHGSRDIETVFAEDEA
jgi:toxin ParE1/3/4